MHTVEFGCGMHVAEAAKLLVAEAAEHGRAQGVFNDVTLTATPDMAPEAVVALYHQESERRAEEWRNSPEGRAATAKSEADLRAAQETHDSKVRELESIDFTNDAAVLDWLCAIQAATDHVGVSVAKEKIISAFRAHGFEPNVNCGSAFKADDRDNVFRWLVGQALDGLQSVAIHGVIHKFAADWKSKFLN